MRNNDFSISFLLLSNFLFIPLIQTKLTFFNPLFLLLRNNNILKLYLSFSQTNNFWVKQLVHDQVKLLLILNQMNLLMLQYKYQY